VRQKAGYVAAERASRQNRYEAGLPEVEHRMEAGLSERQVEIFLDAIIAMAEPVPRFSMAA